mgnify:CR=1 FL=1|tara:strand:+ start:289 stop:600 length:312 start_codon:yes stop_codon:yes gene_type:complete
MVQSILPTLLTKPSKQRATWKSPFTDEQRVHFDKVATQQKQIDDMATARELVQMFYSKDKTERNTWLREALNRIASKQGSGHANNIRTFMTAVRTNEYENDLA